MQRGEIYTNTNNEKDMYLDIYIYIYGTPFAHEKGRLSRGGGTIYIYIIILESTGIGFSEHRSNTWEVEETQPRRRLKISTTSSTSDVKTHLRYLPIGST